MWSAALGCQAYNLSHSVLVLCVLCGMTRRCCVELRGHTWEHHVWALWCQAFWYHLDLSGHVHISFSAYLEVKIIFVSLRPCVSLTASMLFCWLLSVAWVTFLTLCRCLGSIVGPWCNCVTPRLEIEHRGLPNNIKKIRLKIIKKIDSISPNIWTSETNES